MVIAYLLVAVAIIVVLYFHLVRNFNYWKNKNVPFIKPIPLLGNMLSIVKQEKSIGTFLWDIYKGTNLPYFGFFVFDQPYMLLRDPDLIKKVLVSNFDHFEDRSIMENKKDKFALNALFMMKQPKWKFVRTKVTPAFSSGKLKNMLPLIVEAGEDFSKHIKEVCVKQVSSESRDISAKYAIDVISSCAFGIKANSHQNSEFTVCAKKLKGITFSRLIQMFSHFFAPFMVKIFGMKFTDPDSGNFLKFVFLNTIKQRKLTTVNRGDLIDLMIQHQKQEAVVFDDDMLVSLALQYLIAGYETSGSTISYILYELALDVNMQNRLREEILAVLGHDEPITYDAIQEMKYLEMVIKEALRKYPTLPFLDRRCTKTYQIPNTNVVIDKGIPVYISLFALQLDEKYFPDPLKFDPERFSPENKSKIVPYTYLPFGEGYRQCLGTKFGMLSVSVALISILKNFEVEMSPDTPRELVYENSGFLSIPKGGKLHVSFKSLF